MIRHYLVLSGLFILPLLVIHGYDFRYPREILAVGLAIAITVYHLFCYKLEFPDNKWMGWFLLWSVASLIFVPKINGLVVSGGASFDGLWNFKPLFYLVIYILMFFVIADFMITESFIKFICYTICVSSTITAIIVIGQFFGVENFFKNPTANHLISVTQYKLGGLMGHPTIAAAFLVVCLPLVLYIRQWIPVILICLAVLATRSDMAIVTMFLSGIFYFCYGKRTRMVFSIIGLIFFISIIIMMKLPVQDSGRFAIWSLILRDMTTPFLIPNGLTYFFTGFGIGSFSYIFPSLHSNDWLQAHNEYLQVFYGTGAVGLGIILYGIWKIFKDLWKMMEDKTIRFFATSFFSLCLLACGTFIWQLGVFQFYTVIILGIIYNLHRSNYAKE